LAERDGQKKVLAVMLKSGSVPLVSVIIPSYNSEMTVRATLRSVLAQDVGETYEVIVADSSIDDTPGVIGREYPSVHLLHRKRRMQSGTARNLGISAARGQILAFTDSDCIVPPFWLRRLVAHHRQYPEYAAVGGVIANGNPEGVVSWAGYLAEFNIHLPEERGPCLSDHIPTSNISYKRWVFERYGGFPGDEVVKHVDLLFNRMLYHNGERILCDPRLSVAHIHRTRPRDFLHHQRQIGRGTVQAMRRLPAIPGSWLARHPYAAVTLLPAVVVLKFSRNSVRFAKWSPEVARKRPVIFPLFALGLIWWAAGFGEELLFGVRHQAEWAGNRELHLGEISRAYGNE
jgi:glycosyltransferase involved in cell wall biosynthesis